MASWRTTDNEDEVQSYLKKVSRGEAGVNPEIQTQARSSGNPRTQAFAQQQVDRQMQQNERQAQDAAKAQQQAVEQQRRDQEQQQRQQAAQQREDQARRVREAAAAGAETKTDIETGRRSIDTNPDGSVKFKTGPVGDVTGVPVVDKSISTIPILGGVLNPSGKASEFTGVQPQQTYRDAYGTEKTVDLPTKTDAKTGEVTANVGKDSFGAPMSKVVGVDPSAQAKAERDAKQEAEAGRIAMLENQHQAARQMFEPRFQPVKAEYLKAKSELESIPDSYRRNANGTWSYISPQTQKEEPAQPEAVARHQQKLAEAKARLARAQAAYDPLAPQAENLTRVERDIAAQKNKLQRDRLAAQYGLDPTDETLGDLIVKHDQAAAGMPAAQPDMTRAADPSVPPVQTADPYEALVQGAAEASKGAPLLDSVALSSIDRSPEGSLNSARKVLAPFVAPESLTIGQAGRPDETGKPGFFLLMNKGSAIGTVTHDAGGAYIELNSGTPNYDQLINLDAKSGVPVYLGVNTPNRKNPAQTAEWVKQITGLVDTPLGAVQGPDGQIVEGSEDPRDTPAARAAALRDLGGGLDQISQAAAAGEIPIQVAESLAQKLYGTSIKASDPNDPAKLQEWLEATTRAERSAAIEAGTHGSFKSIREQWEKAQPGQMSGDAAMRNQINRRYLGEWLAANRGKPFVSRKDIQARMAAGAPGPNSREWKGIEAFKKTNDFLQKVGMEAAGSTAGILGGLPLAEIQRARGFLGDDEARRIAREFDELRGISTSNFGRGTKRNLQLWLTPDGIGKQAAFNDALKLLAAEIDQQEESRTPDKAAVDQAKDALIKATMQLHGLAPDENWPVTEDILKNDKATAYSLNRYIQTADPNDIQQLRERLLMTNGQRQLAERMDKKLAGLNSFEAAMVGGAYAGWQEIGTEVAVDVASLFSLGAAKGVQLGLKGVGATVKAARVARMTERVAASLAKFEQIGLKAATLERPLALGDKAKNALVKAVKVGGNEAVENVVTSVGENDPDMLQAAFEGFIGGPMLAPAFYVVGKSIGAVGEGINAGRINAENGKFANTYNKTFADLPGFKPITREQAGAARALVNTPDFEAAQSDYQSALGEFKAAQESAEPAIDRIAIQAKLERVTGQLSKVRESMEVEGVTPDRLAALTAQERQLSEAEQKFTGELQAPDPMTAAMQARQKMADVHGRLSEMTVDATDAVQEISELDSPKMRTYYSGIAKVATGNEASLTQNERTAIGGAKTANGAAYFATAPDGRSVLTDEARAELRATMPALGKLVKTTESEALFDAQMGAAAAQAAPAPAAQPVPPNGTPPSPQTGRVTPAPAAPVSIDTPDLTKNPAAIEAADYQSFRSFEPSMPDIPTVVGNAFAAGNPVSLSMAQASGIEIPANYQQQGKMLVPTVAETREENPVAAGSPAVTRARSVAEAVKARIEASNPSLKGRIEIVEQSLTDSQGNVMVSGGAAAAQDGKILVVVPDLVREIARNSEESINASLEQVILRHEAVHIAQYDAVRAIWEQQGEPGSFSKFFQSWYGKIANELSPEAMAAGRNIYGAQAWDAISSDANRAAELVRMLIEAKLDPAKADEFSELFRAIKVGYSPTLIETLKQAIATLVEMIRTGKLSRAAQEHLDAVEQLYRELLDGQPQATEEAAPAGLRIEPEADGKASVRDGKTILWRGPAERAEAVLEQMAATDTPMQVTGAAIADAIRENPNLTAKSRAQLESIAEDLTDALESMPADQRRAAIDAAISEWVASQQQELPSAETKKQKASRRSIDTGARAKAYQLLNSGEYDALTKLFQSGNKIAPRPNLISLILARKKSGAKLTSNEIRLLENNPEYDGAAFQSQFANSGTGKVAREIIGLLMARQGEGTRPDVMAGYLGEGMTASDMWQQIGNELTAIANGQPMAGSQLDPNRDRTDAEIQQELAKQEAEAGTTDGQNQRFEAANTASNGEPFYVEDFTPDSIGTTVTVDGEEMRVTDVQMDSLGNEAEVVVLDDHTRFGRQVLANGDVVYLETEGVDNVEDGAMFSSPSRNASVDIPDAIVTHDLGAAANHPDYAAAKAGDRMAALRVARSMVTAKMIEAIRAQIGDSKPIVVPVIAIEAGGLNAIPQAVSDRLQEKMGLAATNEIVQSIRSYRSEKSGLDRVFSQPAFNGPVEQGADYLLIDDTLTQGGTFAALADHITSNGGKVVGAVALTGKQYSATLRLSEGLLNQLRARIGDVEDAFRSATGYGFERLTQSEARTLLSWRPVERVRDRIIEESRSRNSGLDALDEGQASSPLAASPSVPPFYSQLQRTIEAKMPNSATPAQVLQIATIGAKAEEVKWSGLIPWLQGREKVAKADVLEWLANEGAVRFQEVTQSDQPETIQWTKDGNTWTAKTGNLRATIEGMTNGKFRLETGSGTRDVFPSLEEAKSEVDDMARRMGTSAVSRPTRYAQYVLPGGENYREVVLAMPPKGPASTRINSEGGGYDVMDAEGLVIGTYAAKSPEEAMRKAVENGSTASRESYTSSHFPDVQNYVAHMRLNERKDTTGAPGLFIEELQSDRHQAGRTKGYKGDIETPAAKAYLGKIPESVRPDAIHLLQADRATGDATEAYWKRLDNAAPDVDHNEIHEIRDSAANEESIADAPYRKEWPLALFKRALRDAVASGKDWIGWTVGETQNDRFDLSKQVDSVSVTEWPAAGPGMVLLTATKDGGEVIKETIPEAKIEDYVGKDVARKLMDQPAEFGSRELSGDGLKVGGSGMKGFYDNILPKEIGKYVKQWGGKVQTAELLLGKGMPLNSIMEKFMGTDWGSSNQDQKDQAAAMRSGQRGVPIHRITITPEMRKGVESGQALFSSPSIGRQGSFDFGTSGDFSTRNQTGFNFDTTTPAKLEGDPINKEWTAFSPQSGTLGIPRADMPQVRADDRSALVQFLRARGVDYTNEEVLPGSLKPTQAEYSQKKVDKAREFEGGSRSILVSADGYVVDGHHQWMAKLTDTPRELMPVIRLDAPIEDLLPMIHEMPSATTAVGAESNPNNSAPKSSASAPSSITDFGEKIGGARKDLWSTFRDAIKADLPDNMADFTMAKNFPEPNWEKLIESGVSPYNVAAMKALRDLVPRKPGSNYKILRWSEVVRTLHGLVQKIVGGEMDMAADEIQKLTAKYPSIARQIRLYQALGMPAILGAKEWSIDRGSFSQLGQIKAAPGKYFDGIYVRHKGRSFIQGMSGLDDAETFDRLVGMIRDKIAEESRSAPSAKATEFQVFQNQTSGEIWIGKKMPGRVVRMKGGFESARDALDWKKENQSVLEAQWAEMKKEPVLRRASNDPRVGVSRRDGDVLPEDFQAAFGFRGVEFGNWVEGERRQADLNESYDALTDMAEILGIPTQALSLDGSLGMAFGARGGGSKAAAHYEPGKVVINLTKTKGAGSLAHEWFHGLDNYFARLDKLGTTNPTSIDRYATDASKTGFMSARPAVWNAFNLVRNVLSKGTFAERSDSLDSARSKPYYGTTIEKAARAFEKYVTGRLEEKGAANDYLANLDKNSEAYPNDEEMANGIAAAFDNLFQTLETKPTDRGVMLFSSPSELGRTRNVVQFSDPIETPLGKVTAYEWQSKLDEVSDPIEGMVLKRVSDWDKAVTNAETGRDIVHHFVIEKSDGTTSRVSLESTLKQAGSKTTDLKSRVAAARRLPVRMAELKALEAQVSEYDKAWDKAQKLTPPEPELRESTWPGLRARGMMQVWIGDQEQGPVNPDNAREWPLPPDQLAAARSAWRRSKVGVKEPDYQRINDLRRLIKRDQEKLRAFDVAAPANREKLAEVRVAEKSALGAYRTLTAKREAGKTLTSEEEQTLLDAEQALGQTLAFDMGAVASPAPLPPVTVSPSYVKPSVLSTQQDMSLPGEVETGGQMRLLSSPTIKRDADYLAAVESGDMETAQRMVDEAAAAAGYNQRAYHGTWRAGFTKFKELTHFSPDRIYADRYQSPSASSMGISGVKEATNQSTYEVFLKMLKPFDTRNPEARKLFESEFLGKWGNGTPIQERGLPDWTDSVDLAEWLNEEHPGEFDSFVLDEGAEPTEAGRIQVRPESFVPLDPRNIKSADPVTRDAQGNVIPLSQRFNPESDSILFSSPLSREVSDAVITALKNTPPLFTQVFDALSNGATEAEIAKKFDLNDRQVTNILNVVRSKIETATAAASPEGLKPLKVGDKFADGRPDLALSTNPQIAAVDQIRNESGVPDIRGWDEVNATAERYLQQDYQGAYAVLLNKARSLQAFTDVEVAATKQILAKETLAGKISSPADRVKLAMLIHGYRDIGTETARSLAIRRDPHKTPAERHAQFIAEALFTPDDATRARMRKAPAGQQEGILEGWMRRVDAINEGLKMRGIDIQAALSDYRATIEARTEAEKAAPTAAKAIEDAFSKRTAREKLVIQSIRDGATATGAARLSGMTVDEIKPIWIGFVSDFRANLQASAKRFVETVLASSPSTLFRDIEAQFGIFDWEAIDDSKPDFVDRRNEKPKPERKPKPKAEPAPRPPVTPGDMTLEEWAKRPPQTWRTLFETEMRDLQPGDRLSFEEWTSREFPESAKAWQEEMDLLPQEKRMTMEEWANRPMQTSTAVPGPALFEDPKAPINETTGTFDLNDPVSMKQVLTEFAIARGGKLDAVMEFWRMSILSGPQTHIVNIGSNTLNSAYNLLPRRAVEATVNSLLGLVGQGDVKSATFGEFAGMVKALRPAIQGAARTALRSWQLESRTFESYATAVAQQLDFTGVGTEYQPPALGGKFGKFMRSISFRAMTAADEFQKRLYGQIEAAAQAHRIAKSEEKLSGDAYSARVAELMEPGSIAWLRALEESKRITFQQDIDGTSPKAIARLDQLAELAKKGRSMPYLGKPLTFFLPFIDTPLNIFKQAVEMSPIGGMLAVVDGARALRRKIFRGELTQAEADLAASELYDSARLVQDLTNQSLGIALYFALAGLCEPPDDDESGLPMITGTIAYKTTKRGERDVAGRTMPEQSIRIGGTTFSYARFEPFATLLAGTVDAIVNVNRTGFTAESASNYAMSFKDSVKDKTFLKGVADLINAMEDPDRFLENLAGNVITGFVPNLIRQPAREIDPVVRDTRPREDDGFFEALAKKVGYSVVPQAAPVKTDVWGNTVSSRRGSPVGGMPLTDTLIRIIDPTNVAVGAQIDPIDRYIFNHNLQTPDSKDRISIMPIDDHVVARVDGKPKKIPLTPAEQAEANRNAGRAAHDFLSTQQWDWTNPTEEGAKRIADVVSHYQAIERDRLRNAKVLGEGQ